MKINYYKVYSSKVGDTIENEFDEKWTKIDSGEAYEIAQKAVPENKNRLRLYDLVEVAGDGTHYGTYYMAFYAGGLNGSGKWPNYLEDIKKVFENIPDSWMIDLANDCCDDVFDFVVGFRVKNEDV